MANNVMQGIRVCDGYLVCLDLCVDSPATAPEILLATSCACVGFPRSGRDDAAEWRKYFPQFLRTKVSIQ